MTPWGLPNTPSAGRKHVGVLGAGAAVRVLTGRAPQASPAGPPVPTTEGEREAWEPSPDRWDVAAPGGHEEAAHTWDKQVMTGLLQQTAQCSDPSAEQVVSRGDATATWTTNTDSGGAKGELSRGRARSLHRYVCVLGMPTTRLPAN